MTKLSILNAASLVGRVAPGFFARSFGVFNMLLIPAIACNALLFSMFGVTDTVAFAIFSPLFGFFSGACTSPWLTILRITLKPLRRRLLVSAYCVPHGGSLHGDRVSLRIGKVERLRGKLTII